MFSAVVFDMDGLLIDSERSLMRAWMTAAAEIGSPLQASDYMRIVGIASGESELMLNEMLGGADRQALARAKVIEALAREDGAGIAFPAKLGAAQLMAELSRRGVPCGVASSSRIEEIRHRLAAVQLDQYLIAMAGGNEVPRAKPDPAVYLLAAERMGVKPSDCLAFEDSHNGVKAARAAGMQIIAVPDLVTPDAAATLMQLASLDLALPHLDTWFPAHRLIKPTREPAV